MVRAFARASLVVKSPISSLGCEMFTMGMGGSLMPLLGHGEPGEGKSVAAHIAAVSGGPRVGSGLSDEETGGTGSFVMLTEV